MEYDTQAQPQNTKFEDRSKHIKCPIERPKMTKEEAEERLKKVNERLNRHKVKH